MSEQTCQECTFKSMLQPSGLYGLILAQKNTFLLKLLLIIVFDVCGRNPVRLQFPELWADNTFKFSNCVFIVQFIKYYSLFGFRELVLCIIFKSNFLVQYKIKCIFKTCHFL